MQRALIRQGGQIVLAAELPSEFHDQGCVALIRNQVAIEVTPGIRVRSGDYEAEIITDENDGPVSGTESKTITEIDLKGSRGDNQLELHAVVPGYEIVGLLGMGGMGIVWRARQKSTRRMVALKTIKPTILDSESARERFQREVELAAKLTQPNIAQVYDSGEHNGLAFYSMQLIEGRPWNDYVRARKPARHKLLSQLLQVLDAVGAAHKANIVHRDLKPSNILIDESGNAFVVDFGLAKPCEQSNHDLFKTTEGSITGTLAFMAPEQAAGHSADVDAQSDVYSLAVVLLYLLNNDVPYDTDGSAFELQKQIVEANVRADAFDSLASDSRLEGIVRKALSLKRIDRYHDAADFAGAITSYLESQMGETRCLDDAIEVPTPRLANVSIAHRAIAVLAFSFILIAAATFVVTQRDRVDAHPSDAVQAIDDSEQAVDDKGQPPQKLTEEDLARVGRVGREGVAGKSTWSADGNTLVGFRFYVADFRGDLIIKSLMPVYRSDEGDVVNSEFLGNPNKGDLIEVIAEPGFAIGKIEGIGGERLHAMRVTFMKQAGKRLDPTNAVSSQWFGGSGDGIEQSASTAARVAVGVYGAWDADIDILGLLTIAE